MARNQWPDFDLGPDVHTVRRVLVEEGSGIEQKTRGAIRFEVLSRPEGERRFGHTCYLVAPSMGYRFPFMYVEHGLEQYPVTITTDVFPRNAGAADEKSLRDLLGEVFRSDATKNVVVQILDAVSGQTVS